MPKQISSVQNPLVKQLFNLIEKSRERRKSGLFVIEGGREIGLALEGGYMLKSVLFCPDLFSEEKLTTLEAKLEDSTELIEINLDVFQKLAYRSSTEGILALAESREHPVRHLKLTSPNPLILVAEAPEKPGNIGALLRTADAAAADAVIIANPKTDLYNPNIVRSSVGGVFTNQIALGTTKEIIAFLKENKITVFCAALQASKPYTQCDFSLAAAIVLGTEATGLSSEWLENSSENIVIPMHGVIDSMNVSVAAGILLFEAKRQRTLQS
ncbi:MAG: RNA methyltransferase [Flavobacteriaceae bacterium]|nr:RNA methyltransferase [Flavobacteriaceae bacterium]